MSETIDNRKKRTIEDVNVDNAEKIKFEWVLNLLDNVDENQNKKIDENEINWLLNPDFLWDEENIKKMGEILSDEGLNKIDDKSKKELLISLRFALDWAFNEIIKKEWIIWDEDKKMLELREQLFWWQFSEENKKLQEFNQKQDKLIEEKRIEEEKRIAEEKRIKELTEKLNGYINRIGGLPDDEKKNIKEICNIDLKWELSELDYFEKELKDMISNLATKDKWREDDINNVNTINKIIWEDEWKEKWEIREQLEASVQNKVNQEIININNYVVKNGEVKTDIYQWQIIQLWANVLSWEKLVLDWSRWSEQWNFKSQTENEKKTNAYLWKMLIENRDNIIENRKKEKNLLYLPDLDDYLNQISEKENQDKVWTNFLDFFLGKVNRRWLYFEDKITWSRLEELLNMMIRAEKTQWTSVEEEISYLEWLDQKNDKQEDVLLMLKSWKYGTVPEVYEKVIEEFKKEISDEMDISTVQNKKKKLREKLNNFEKEKWEKAWKYKDIIQKYREDIEKAAELNELKRLDKEFDEEIKTIDENTGRLNGQQNNNSEISDGITVADIKDIFKFYKETQNFSNWDAFKESMEWPKIADKLLSLYWLERNGSFDKFDELVTNFAKENKIAPKPTNEFFQKLITKTLTKCMQLWVECIRKMTDKNNIFNWKEPIFPKNRYKIAEIKEKLFTCVDGLESIGKLKDSIWFLDSDIRALKYNSFEDVKSDNGNDSIKAFDYIVQYWNHAYDSNLTNRHTTDDIEWKYNSHINIYAPWAYSKLMDKERIYIDNGEKYTLSLKDYNELFCNFYQNKQGELWDCYLVSTIRGLARTEFFDTLIRTSITKYNDGSYTVRLPLWEPWWKLYKISKYEIDKAKIKWRDWYKILELAYIKCASWNTGTLTEEDIKKAEAGTWRDCLSRLLWCEWYTVYSIWNFAMQVANAGENSLSDAEKKRAKELLKNFNPSMWDIVSVDRWGRKEKNLRPRHVQAVVGVIKDSNWEVSKVVIENPWNNTEVETTHEVSIDDFLKQVTHIHFGSINENFLNNSTNYLQDTLLYDQQIIYNITNIPAEFKHYRDKNITKQHRKVSPVESWINAVTWILDIAGNICVDVGNATFAAGKEAVSIPCVYLTDGVDRINNKYFDWNSRALNYVASAVNSANEWLIRIIDKGQQWFNATAQFIGDGYDRVQDKVSIVGKKVDQGLNRAGEKASQLWDRVTWK